MTCILSTRILGQLTGEKETKIKQQYGFKRHAMLIKNASRKITTYRAISFLTISAIRVKGSARLKRGSHCAMHGLQAETNLIVAIPKKYQKMMYILTVT